MCLYLYTMGEQVKERESYDSRYLKIFKVGDLVSWRNLNSPKEYGYIIKIYNQSVGRDRKFMFALVRKTDGSVEPFMLSQIQKES